MLNAHQCHSTVELFSALGWVPSVTPSQIIKRHLLAYKRIMGLCPTYMNELLEQNSSQRSRVTRSAKFTFLPSRFNRAKEGGCAFSVTAAKC